MELRGTATLAAILVPHHDPGARGVPGGRALRLARAVDRQVDRRRTAAGAGVPAGATALPLALDRRGDQSGLDALLLPAAVALRRAARDRVLPSDRHRSRRALRRGHRTRERPPTKRRPLAAAAHPPREDALR